MQSETRALSARVFFLNRSLPALLIIAAIGIAAQLILQIAASESDRVALDRQTHLFTMAVGDIRASIAHDQESVTVWDDSVTNLRKGDLDWVDINLGSWMHSYFGHDAAFVLSPDDTPLYAFDDEARQPPEDYDRIAACADPLVAGLHEKQREQDSDGLSDRILTQGASDFCIVTGRPAVISAKPVVTDSGKEELEQEPGREYTHIALRFVDGDFLTMASQRYMILEPRFSPTAAQGSGEASIALQTASGNTLGYFVWRPWRPGHAILDRMTLVLAALTALIAMVVEAFLYILSRRLVSQQRAEARARHLASHDLLTGLPNRLQFQKAIDSRLADTGHDQAPLCLLYLDIDRFKQVNEIYGHLAGDSLISAVGARLGALVRDTDIIARIAGNQFGLFMSGVADENEAECFCNRLFDALRAPFLVEDEPITVTFSAGFTLTPATEVTREEIERQAEIALDYAKTTGRNRHVGFKPQQDEHLRERRQLEAELRLALAAEDQLVPHYQPVFNAAGDRITGMEVLLRWFHPQRGPVSPAFFIPIAEQCGLIEEIDAYVLRRACAAARQWPDLIISVNASAVELRRAGYADRTAATLAEYGLSPRNFEIEVTETAMIDRTGECNRTIRTLRDLGFGIALDDFGTGFSSLGHLQQFKVDRIKIDRSFIMGLDRPTNGRAIVSALIQLAQAMNIRTTAEGVETAGQQTLLAEMGCDSLQGYYLSRPLSEAQMLERIARQQNFGLAV
ncbi:bifunctional diguanylate cyclase/phosphodiesterase [Radicibacter daui]|uniref:bifunctional diguanylate cyclase/phosphodiesterase n=1 Tax=Radicibacter daui TaxID=3064829 RepID=UPI004046C4E7